MIETNQIPLDSAKRICERIRKTKDGIHVIDGDTHITKWTEEQGRIDTDRTVDRLLQFIPVGGVVVDAGASIGDHTVPYARKVGGAGTVIAFEPNEAPFQCLKLNCRDLPQVIAVKVGLGEKEQAVKFQIDEHNLGASHARSDGTDEIYVDPLDSVNALKILNRLDFFKLDIEGMEPAALRGASGVIDKFKPVIYCEINDVALQAQGCTRHDIFRFLESHGYGYEPFTGNFLCTQFDIICKPIK